MSYKEYIRIKENADCAVLMVHGIANSPRHFDWLIPLIPNDWSICNILLDGHGGSVKDFSKTSMTIWKQQVDSCMESLANQHKTIIVVGYSMGTLLTMRLVEKYPQIKGMILLNTPLEVAVKPAVVMRYLKMAFGKLDMNNPVELATYNGISVKMEPWLWRYLWCIPQVVELLALCKECRNIVNSFKIPCYAFWGKQDEAVSLKSTQYFIDNYNVSCKVFDNSGHFYYESEFKDEVSNCIKLLIEQVSEKVYSR
ncbi:MAG: alpha/beta fold hydrolase [Acutalibacteraceae bacterium]|jgi:esterase/lipase|nr:alpha/beta fold hydrolase [Acutalibacteraceae bacterium]